MIKITEDEPKLPIYFEPELDLRAEGPRCVWQLAGLLQQEDQREKRRSALSHSLIDALLTALLTRLLHSGQRGMEPAPHRLTPGYLRRAEEYMVMNLAEPVTMTAVAERAGVSVRTLQSAFQEYRKCSPMSFLQERRLQEARRRLLTATPDRAVATIARETGFQHLGRFSARYRERFGESPSATHARLKGVE